MPVAPRVGAWIETKKDTIDFQWTLPSHPVWVRGLKHIIGNIPPLRGGRTPCGCVD